MRYLSREKQSQFFSSLLLRLLVPKKPNEPHNFMPDYQYNLINQPGELVDTRIKNQAIPFYKIDPRHAQRFFMAGNANNFGALIFLNAIMGRRIKTDTLCLVRSEIDRNAYYFTQLLSPSWLTFFDSDHHQPFDFSDKLEENILDTIDHFCSEHLDWWIGSSFFIRNESPEDTFTIHYDKTLSDELFTTMFRLYLTPKPLIDLLLNFVFKTPPQESIENTHLKSHIHTVIENFKLSFKKHILPKYRAAITDEMLLNAYNNYLYDIYQFSLFPIGSIGMNYRETIFPEIEKGMLLSAVEIHLPQLYQIAFKAFISDFKTLMPVLENDSFIAACKYFFKEARLTTYWPQIRALPQHELWKTLNLIAQYISNDENLTISINISKTFEYILIKSIELKYYELGNMLINQLESKKELLKISQKPLSDSDCMQIGHPEWVGYGLVDIASQVKNIHVGYRLTLLGARALQSRESHSPHSISMFRAEPKKISPSCHDLSSMLKELTETEKETPKIKKGERRKSYST